MQFPFYLTLRSDFFLFSLPSVWRVIFTLMSRHGSCVRGAGSHKGVCEHINTVSCDKPALSMDRRLRG